MKSMAFGVYVLKVTIILTVSHRQMAVLVIPVSMATAHILLVGMYLLSHETYLLPSILFFCFARSSILTSGF